MSPARQGLTWLPPLIARTCRQLPRPLNDERAGERDHDAAVDDARAEPALALGVVVEVHPRRVLVEPGGEPVLALHHAHAVDVVDPLADLIVLEEVGRAGLRRVDPRRAQACRHDEPLGRDRLGQLGHDGFGRRERGSRLRTITQRT